MMNLMTELKRRRVFRVAGVYAAVAFVVWQVADIAVPALQLPSWLVTAVVALSILGFPIAFVLAWAFDITPEGVMRTEAAPEEAGTVERPTPARRPVTGLRLAVAGAVTIVVVGAAAYLVLREGGELETSRVVVDVFTNRTGDPQLDVIGMMAADVLVEALQGAGTLQVVPLNAAVDAARNLEGETRSSRPQRASALAAEFQARVIVSGSYYLESDSLRFVAEVTDARRRQLLHTTPALAAPRGTPSLALMRMRDEVLRFLSMWGGEAHLGHELIAANLASQPNLAAYREWAVGDELFTRGEFREAQPYFARAVALDSTFTRALGRAILSHTNVGEYEAAEPYVQRLLGLRERMTPYERVAADWVIAVHARDWQRQYLTSRQLASMVPVPVWLYVAGMNATRVNRPAEAVAVLARVDPAGGYASRWRPFWSVYGNAHHQLGDYRRELRVIRRGRVHHPDFPAYIQQELIALAGLGRTDDVLARLDELLGTADPTRAMQVVAHELEAHDHAAAARLVAERAVSRAESRQAGTADLQEERARAGLLALLGRNEEARSVLESAVARWPENLDAQGELGALAARLGDRARAEQAFHWLDSADVRQAPGRQRYLQASIAAELGENARAVSLLREAFAQGQPFGVEVHRNPHFRRLRDDTGFRELLRPKG
jgi:tetratricopeptide (TPR) repeat protein/TolB-like protein